MASEGNIFKASCISEGCRREEGRERKDWRVMGGWRRRQKGREMEEGDVGRGEGEREK